VGRQEIGEGERNRRDKDMLGGRRQRGHVLVGRTGMSVSIMAAMIIGGSLGSMDAGKLVAGVIAMVEAKHADRHP